MTKVIIPAVAMMMAVSAQAADINIPLDSVVRQNTGIGLGTIVFDGHDGVLSQVSAVYTNHILCNQSFAITSGTLDAQPFDGIVSNKRVQGFVRDNLDQLAREMAAGQGESLDTLAELIAIPVAERKPFARNLQQHFGKIYSSPTVTNTEVVANLAKVLGKA